MTSNFHTPISTGAAVNAATVNNPLSQLDSQISGSFAGIAHTVIDGMKLTWNSATSITISEGVCYAQNGNLINAASSITKSGLSLSASTWYHIYVYLSGGTPATEVVTTAPVAWKGTAYSKTGDTSRRYVGSIKTDGSGNVYSFIMDGEKILYRENLAASPFRVLSGGTATTETEVSSSAIVSVTARISIVRIYNSSTNANVATGTPDDNITLSGSVCMTLTAVSTTIVVMHPVSSDQKLNYIYNTTPSGGNCNIDVYGYVFRR